MFTVPATRGVRAIGVLLGGSGLARHLPLQPRPLAALLKPLSARSPEQAGRADRSAVEVSPC